MSSCHKAMVRFLGILCLALAPAYAQNEQRGISSQESPSETTEEGAEAPKGVDVHSIADDEAIAARLRNILQATQWFDAPHVRVREGVAFPHGVPVHMVNGDGEVARRADQRDDELPDFAAVPDPVSTTAEGELRSEDKQIQEQARRARSPEEGEDLLRAASTDAGG